MKLCAKSLLGALLFAVTTVNLSFSMEFAERRVLNVPGVLEVREICMRARISGQLEQIVPPGVRVQEGDVLADLDTDAIRREIEVREGRVRLAESDVYVFKSMVLEGEGGVALAEASLDLARARLAEALAGAPQEAIAAADAALQRALIEEASLQRECDLMKQRRDSGIATTEEYSKAQADYEIAAVNVQEMRARLDDIRKGPSEAQIEQHKALVQMAEARLELAKAKARLRQDRLQQAVTRLELAKETLDEAQEDMAAATLRSPVAGKVIATHADAGDFVRAGMPLVTIADTSRLWVRTYVSEADIGRVKVGQPARLALPSMELMGHVSAIALKAEARPRDFPRSDDSPRRVFRVDVALESIEEEIPLGVSASVEIEIERHEDTGVSSIELRR